MVLLAENDHLRTPKFWRGADLVVEIVREDDLDRDLIVKRAEYARAGIREYWIVDPRDESICVLSLTAPVQSYAEVGHYRRGEQAASVLLHGFTADVDAVFSHDAAN